MGKHGDGGCDGLADNGSILYACYGQRATSGIDQKTKDKLESDFARGIASWESFSTWRFVTNAPFGPMPTKSVQVLRKQHAPGTQRPITIEIWKADDLWWKAVSKLTASQLDEIIPGVPHAQNVKLADLVELILSLERVDGDDPDYIKSIRPVSPTKMDFNNLPETTRGDCYRHASTNGFPNKRTLSCVTRRLNASASSTKKPGGLLRMYARLFVESTGHLAAKILTSPQKGPMPCMPSRHTSLTRVTS